MSSGSRGRSTRRTGSGSLIGSARASRHTTTHPRRIRLDSHSHISSFQGGRGDGVGGDSSSHQQRANSLSRTSSRCSVRSPHIRDIDDGRSSSSTAHARASHFKRGGRSLFCDQHRESTRTAPRVVAYRQRRQSQSIRSPQNVEVGSSSSAHPRGLSTQEDGVARCSSSSSQSHDISRNNIIFPN